MNETKDLLDVLRINPGKLERLEIDGEGSKNTGKTMEQSGHICPVCEDSIQGEMELHLVEEHKETLPCIDIS